MPHNVNLIELLSAPSEQGFTPMITVTSRAKTKLKEMKGDGTVKEGKLLRLATPPTWTGEGDFGLVLDIERMGDTRITQGNVILLLIDPALNHGDDQRILDFKATSKGSNFSLDIY